MLFTFQSISSPLIDIWSMHGQISVQIYSDLLRVIRLRLWWRLVCLRLTVVDDLRPRVIYCMALRILVVFLLVPLSLKPMIYNVLVVGVQISIVHIWKVLVLRFNFFKIWKLFKSFETIRARSDGLDSPVGLVVCRQPLSFLRLEVALLANIVRDFGVSSNLLLRNWVIQKRSDYVALSFLHLSLVLLLFIHHFLVLLQVCSLILAPIVMWSSIIWRAVAAWRSGFGVQNFSVFRFEFASLTLSHFLKDIF